MRSPKGGKNKLTHNSPVKKVLKGKGAAKAKNPKREISRETIEKFLLRYLDDAKKASPKKASPRKVLPRKPRLPLTKQEKETLKVMRSIGKLVL